MFSINLFLDYLTSFVLFMVKPFLNVNFNLFLF